MPALAARRDGKLVKKSHERCGNPFTSIWPKSIAKTSIANIRASNAEQAEEPVQVLCRAMRRRTACRWASGEPSATVSESAGHCQ
jgi:hypothetical protein